MGKCQSGLQRHRGPTLRGASHLGSDRLEGSRSEQKMLLGLVQEKGLKVKESLPGSRGRATDGA